MTYKALLSNKKIIFGCIGLLVLLCGIAAYSAYVKAGQKEEQVTEYNYNAVEQALADEVELYLDKNVELSEKAKGNIADVAVQNYDIVVASDTNVINDDITEAIKNRIRKALIAFVDYADQLTEDDLDGLSSGVTEIIWKMVLRQLELNISSEEKNMDDYLYLTQSLQTQIDDLKERKMKVSINARIIDNTDHVITTEELLSSIDNLSEKELLELAERLGLSVAEIRELVEKSIDNSADDFDEKLKKEIEDLRDELEKDIKNAEGKTGATGATGAKGEKGEKGEQGAAGKAGNDGKTTYIAYADDMYGSNFSLTPTETAKYIGTCISTATTQPTDYSMYSNWQEYRTYIITATTDSETGVTTVHIN